MKTCPRPGWQRRAYRFGCLCALLFCTLSAGAAPAPVIHDLHLHMQARDAKVLFRKDPYDRSSFPVTVVDQAARGGAKLRGRIEVKGSFTRRFAKKSLLIKLQDGANWRGYRKISLNAMATDASLMREWLAWRLIHSLGMAAPRVEYTQVHINGRFIGLYLFVEWITDEVFERHGLGRGGQFFHPKDENFCGDLSRASLRPARRCYFKLAPNDANFTPLRELIEALETTPAAAFDDMLERYFEVDSVINWMAVNILTSNSDTYNKNYFLYQSRRNGKWTVIPWDYDLSFGRNWDPHLKYPKNILNDNFQYFYSAELGMPSPLKDKLLQNPRLLARLKARIAHLLGLENDAGAPAYGWFSPDAMAQRVGALRDLIAADARRDRYNRHRLRRFGQQADSVAHYALARYHYLKTVLLGQPSWIANLATQTTDSQARELHLVDGHGMLLGSLQLPRPSQPVRLSLEVEPKQAPQYTPRGLRPATCVQRTWFLSHKTPAVKLDAELRLSYLEEHSQHHEIGARMRDENKLQLWMYDYDSWQRLPTTVNTYANTLSTPQITLPPGRLLRFVACEGR